MTETIIRLVINVAVIAMAYILGYREGLVKGYSYYIEQSKHIEEELVGIINKQDDNMRKIHDAVFKKDA